MQTVSQIINHRNRRRNLENRNPWLKIGLGFSILLCLIGVGTCLAVVWIYTNLAHDLPSIEGLPGLLEPPNGFLLQTTRLYDRNKEHVLLSLENPAAENKQYLYVTTSNPDEKAQFSQKLIDATVAVVDPGFWKHGGYSTAGWSAGEHPTLAQRLISDLVLYSEPPSLRRNIRERLLAAQITARYGREKVLEWYLNSIQFGDLVYGADAAARVYFGKSASEINLAEAAMLTAISQTPGTNPIIVSEFLKQQQEHVIIAMLAHGVITPEVAQLATQEELIFLPKAEAVQIAPAFTELVLNQVSTMIPLEQLRRGGYEIITSLDYDLQEQAACTVEIQLQRLSGEEVGSSGGEDCEAAQLLPALQSIDGRPIQDVGAEVVVIDPDTGQILAYVTTPGNSNDYLEVQNHPAGTILSPFIYLTSFARGISPSTLLWDIPRQSPASTAIVEGDQSNEQQFIREYHGPVSARTAMANDYYAATEDVLQKVRAENVLQTERSFGIGMRNGEGNSVSILGDIYSQPSSLLDIVSAYGVFANQGIEAGQPIKYEDVAGVEDGLSPSGVIKLMRLDGNILMDWSEPESQPIISPQLAYLITHILADENARWPSLGHPNLLEIGTPAGAKNGTSLYGGDAWTVGYTSELAIGVWVGNSHNVTMKIPAELPASLWHAIMQNASKQIPAKDFIEPDGITQLQVCDPSGLLVTPQCPVIVQEVFLHGSEPTQVDNLYQKFQINRESGLLATVFTPDDMVEEKIFMVVPPSAAGWAEITGLPIPPYTYDAIYSPEDKSQNVSILDPKQFDHINGEVRIIGTANGPGFSYYRVQVGQGLNPQQWIQVGEDVNKPVQGGLLGIWDTNGLEGLYVIQLQVVREDQRVDRALLQVTIDNEQPEVKILAPVEGDVIPYQRGGRVMVQVEPGDNLMVERVEIYIDNQLESVLVQHPYIILWQMGKGEHRVSIKVYDLAGNMNETTSTFIVK